LARFVDGDRSLENLIEFPDIEGDFLEVVHCVAWVVSYGRVRSNTCFASAFRDQRFGEAIESAISSARVTPAIVDGNPRSVQFYYRVVFLQKGGSTDIGVYPNWGHDVDMLGPYYEAPQRYNELFFPSACGAHGRNVGVIATMVVGADGTLDGDVVVRAFGPKSVKKCVKSVKRILGRAKYVPGRHNGMPVKATRVEYQGNYDSIRIDPPD